MKKLGQKTLFAGKYRSMVEKTFELPNGVINNYEIATNNGMIAGMVCAVDKDGKFIMTREFRPGTEKYFYDIPGGGIDEGENIYDGAKRELAEETGYVVGELYNLGRLSLSAYDGFEWQCFLATDCEKKHEQNLGDTEFIEVVLKTEEELLGVMKNGEVVLGNMGVILLALQKLKEIK